MSTKFIITGTDTGIGKTMAASMLTLALDGIYWKPVQSGIEGTVDTRRVQQLTGLPQERFLPEGYVFSEPLSPHRAAELDGEVLDLKKLAAPQVDAPLIIEGAGGLMVPLTRENLLINQFKTWGAPVILCARTGLGTINHTLLSLEALWARKISVHGLLFIGEDNPDNIRTIAEFSGERVLGRLPWLQAPNAKSLRKAFEENFSPRDFVSSNVTPSTTPKVIPSEAEGSHD